MNMTANSLAIYMAIQPDQIALYLRSHGWREQDRIDERASIWVYDGGSGERPEVFLPLDQGLRDYSLRISQALESLEATEHRPQVAIIDDLVTVSSDVIRVRVELPGLTNSSVPLEDGLLLIQSVRDVFVSAARSSLRPAPSFTGKPPLEVKHYLEQVTMGQTERGSYILTIISPVSERPYNLNGAPALPADPFGRRVTQTLARALTFLQRRVQLPELTDERSSLAAAIQNGVSANLCAAIINMNKGSHNTGLTISFRWSAIVPGPRDTPEAFLLSPRMIAMVDALRTQLATMTHKDLEEATARPPARRLATTILDQEALLRGVVIQLERSTGETGTVIILSSVGGAERHIRVELSDEDYRLALYAHEARLPILCQGILIREGDAFVLRNPRGFHIDQINRRLSQ